MVSNVCFFFLPLLRNSAIPIFVVLLFFARGDLLSSLLELLVSENESSPDSVSSLDVFILNLSVLMRLLRFLHRVLQG